MMLLLSKATTISNAKISIFQCNGTWSRSTPLSLEVSF